MTPPPPPPEALVVPLIELGRPLPRTVERRRTVIEDPRGEARFAAEDIITRSFLQGALVTLAAIACWTAYGSATMRFGNRSAWLITGAATMAGSFAYLAFRAGASVSRAVRKLKPTRREATDAEHAACREARWELLVSRICAALTPAYAVLGIVNLTTTLPSSLGLLLASALFGFGAFSFAHRAAERVGTARHETRPIAVD